MPKYLVVDEEQYRAHEFLDAYEVEAASADEAAKEGMRRAFDDWGWEDEWDRDAPDWMVKTLGVDGPSSMRQFTSRMEYAPVFYIREK